MRERGGEEGMLFSIVIFNTPNTLASLQNSVDWPA